MVERQPRLSGHFASLPDPLIPSAQDRGFSLLEVLIVLAIMAVMISLIGVRIVNSVDGTRFARHSEATLAQVKQFRAQAMLTKRKLIIITQDSSDDSGANTATDLQNWPQNSRRQFNAPEGWTISGADIKISEGGICYGGIVNLADGNGRHAQFSLTPPRCDIQRYLPDPR